MSEEIKLRAWYPAVKKMRHFSNGTIICDGPDRCGVFLPCAEGSVFLGQCEVMQFIGLIDRNGKEISRMILFEFGVEKIIKVAGNITKHF